MYQVSVGAVSDGFSDHKPTLLCCHARVSCCNFNLSALTAALLLLALGLSQHMLCQDGFSVVGKRFVMFVAHQAQHALSSRLVQLRSHQAWPCTLRRIENASIDVGYLKRLLHFPSTCEIDSPV